MSKLRKIIEGLFIDFKLGRFLTQVFFYLTISACAFFNLGIANLIIGFLLVATMYIIIADTEVLANVKNAMNLSVFESCTTPLLQVFSIIVLYHTHHFWLLILFTLAEILYIGCLKLYKKGYLN